MTSLREMLGGGRQGIPEFRLSLPAGWTMYDTSGETERALLDRAKVRLREAHRPEVYAVLEGHVTRTLAAARKQGAFVMIMAGEDAPRWSTVPISVLGTITRGDGDVSLDAMVADAVERRGARALDGSKQFLRWTDRRTVELSGETAGAFTVVYLTPVPGSRRTQALQLTATLVHPTDVDPVTDDHMSLWLELLDSHMLTFAWTGR
ncbi:hypothetical protein JOD63_002083 [Microbacterium terrae]|uniref:Uncharacterized protein n=1 Tax=Microbacterium terrae TaxID=69369 RepID=A0A0M2H4V0_9MICO|nr:hypothetical protein [Microbacterium terrae]KJL39523.1 hypothetical protein RS81_01940 [Microbacterium terrae]MBP1078115.1 hypothetical protein [Microbacterium terrae]GLK00283.1 hypothetical protein GCM10017594_34810 [Microbacterium terrae]